MRQGKHVIAKVVAGAMFAVLAACSSGGEGGSAQDKQGGGRPLPPEPTTLSSRPGVTGGEKLYVEYCVMCHGPNAMGSGLLARRVDQPDLEKRTDLTKDYVIAAARTGVGNMPAIPRGEVSDADLGQIADYLASGKGPAGGAK
jgi:mono/diheme cytochrome c family protein